MLLERLNSVIEPCDGRGDILSRCYDCLMLCGVIIGIVPLMFREYNVLFWYFDVISAGLFIIDYILRWVCYGVCDGSRGFWTYVKYPFTFMAVIDLLSILPTFGVLNHAFKLARVSRLMRLLRIVRVMRYFEPFEVVAVVIKRQSRSLLAVLFMSLFYIFVTALMMFNAEGSLFDNFFEALYWSTITLTTVGYGDIHPECDLGRLISMVSSLVGLAVIALPTGIITAGYMDEIKERKEK